MATGLTVGLSVDEYPDRSLDRECELLGGETRPKPLGTGKHSGMQRSLAAPPRTSIWEGLVEFELSVRIGSEVPVPDLVVPQSPYPRMYRDVLDEPPLLCIEVVSPSQLPAELPSESPDRRSFSLWRAGPGCDCRRTGHLTAPASYRPQKLMRSFSVTACAKKINTLYCWI
jgi:hypothetical protein